MIFMLYSYSVCFLVHWVSQFGLIGPPSSSGSSAEGIIPRAPKSWNIFRRSSAEPICILFGSVLFLMMFPCRCVREKEGLGGVSVGANIYYVRTIMQSKKGDSL